MSIHKLTAGSGYDYLTRQVAASDATDKGRTGLADYYAEKGEAPGVWVGSGLRDIDGLEAGDTVTAEQMKALFGSGHDPLARQRVDHLQGPDLNGEDFMAVTRLGVPYKVYSSDVSSYLLEVATRVADLNTSAGQPRNAPVPAEKRARVRTQVAREFFIAEHGRTLRDARELAATIARHSRPRTTAVAGFDLTFRPVKSVSTLWAVADPSVSARIEQAHQAAVRDALSFIEQHALFTREGDNGVRQVNVRGMVATAFTHRDSRAGDPLLHTHVAVANKVQTLSGKWLAVDGRVLFKATVAASETYNTSLERHLRTDLGLRFEQRPDPVDSRKRPVREVVGIDPRLRMRWSSRRAEIEVRRQELASAFQGDHGRPPTPVESLHLAQQATLETRELKHEPRSQADQRAAWRTEAIQVLGGEAGLRRMIDSALTPPTENTLSAASADPVSIARAVVAEMQSRRSTWQMWHVRAEAERRVRSSPVDSAQMPGLVDLVVEYALSPTMSVSLARAENSIIEPHQLRRLDGSSVYTVAGANLFTSTAVLDAEQRLVTAAGSYGGRTVDNAAVDMALLESTANGVVLNAGQISLVRDMVTSGARVQLGIAPAGAGKTTAMRALAAAWIEGGGNVIGLAPSAAAAAVLRDQIGAHTDTLAKLTHDITTPARSRNTWLSSIGPATLVVIDEAGMADTLSLDAAVRFVLDQGGSVRLIGDDRQLTAIGAGGVMRDIQATHGASRLTELVRFVAPAEGAASLALRAGYPAALGFYLDHQRVHVGDLATITADAFNAWKIDCEQGLDSIMVAPTRELVRQLNVRARTQRILDRDDVAQAPTVRLGDGNLASVGDLVITRANDRRLRTTATDWVKNGDRWTVLRIDERTVQVQHVTNQRSVTLPADYVRDFTELGYATTIHAAQGVSVDTMHGLAVGEETRQQLYTMLTRGRSSNHLYLQVVGDGDPHGLIRPEVTHPLTPTDLLERVLARDDAPRSATTALREQEDPYLLLGRATQRYTDSLYVAAEDLLGTRSVAELDAGADRVVPGVTNQAAWPALRAHLMLVRAHGGNPIAQLSQAATSREMVTAADSAAVLDWRLDDSGLRGAGRGPLPWLPAIPHALHEHPTWGPYLQQRAALVRDLASTVHDTAITADTPSWAQHGPSRPVDTVLARITVWRAATMTAQDDRRPTGPPQLQKAAALWQRKLDGQLTGDRTPAEQEWAGLINRTSLSARRDPFAPILAERLAAIARSGIDAASLLRTAAGAGPLPDEHAAAALWWRISRHLSPAVTEHLGHDRQLTTAWTPQMPELLGATRAAAIQQSPWWPALVTTIDHALTRGWTIENLLTNPSDAGMDPGVDKCHTLLWRLSIAMDPVPDDHHGPGDDDAPADLWEGVTVPDDALGTFPDIGVTPVTPSAHQQTLPDPWAPDHTLSPEQRWAGLGSALDQRLPHELDWTRLALILDQADAAGHDVAAVTRRLLDQRPLHDQPAQDLRYRLVAALDLPIEPTIPPPRTAGSIKKEQRAPRTSQRRTHVPRR